MSFVFRETIEISRVLYRFKEKRAFSLKRPIGQCNAMFLTWLAASSRKVSHGRTFFAQGKIIGLEYSNAYREREKRAFPFRLTSPASCRVKRQWYTTYSPSLLQAARRQDRGWKFSVEYIIRVQTNSGRFDGEKIIWSEQNSLAEDSRRSTIDQVDARLRQES